MTDETGGGPQGVRSDAWDLLPGYALDALDDQDREAVDRLLASDLDARRALDEYREVVASFAVETAPPVELRANVLERVLRTPQVAEPSSAEVSDAGATEGGGDAGVVDLAARRRPRHWGAAVAAVAAAVAIAVPTTIAVQVTAERDRLREQSEVVSEMLADPDASVLRGAVEGGGTASVLVADGDMLFQAEGLPEPDQGRVYQLWVVADDGGVASAGVLSLRDGRTTSLVRGADGVGLAVSVEPEGGSEQPTTEPVVILST